MIAALNNGIGKRRCPSNGVMCFSPRCQMGLCQRLDLKPATKPLPLPSARPTAKVCPIDGKRCIEPGLCQVKCSDVKGIGHLAFGQPAMPYSNSRLNAPDRMIPQGGTIVTCPILKNPCLAKSCHSTGMCQAPEPRPESASTAPAKLVSAAVNDPKVLTPVQCPADPAGPLCDAVWCLTRGKCALREEHSGIGPGTVHQATGVNTVPTHNRTDCHKGLYKLGKLGKANIWVGREAAVFRKCPEDQTLFSLVICLIGGHRAEPSWLNEESSVVTGNREAEQLMPSSLFRRGINIPYMHINWPDYGIPNLDLAWWDNFAKCLSEIDGHIAIFCMGGHGRTGTCASILATRAGWVMDGDDPVRWLRSKYCDNAVESSSQADYIEKMCPGWFVNENCAHYDNLGNSAAWENYTHGYNHGARSNIVPMKQQAKPAAKGGASLSKNKYKKHRKAVEKRLGKVIPSLGELDDGELVAVDGHVFMWEAHDQKFRYMGIENGTPDADMPNDIKQQLDPPK